MSLKGKVALVTGASRGIGKAIALELSARGATVLGTSTTSSGAENISTYLRAADNNGQGLTLNVTSLDSIEKMLTSIKSQFEAPTVLVNNAGITKDNLLMRMKPQEWDDVIDTNLNATYRLSKVCVRAMTKARWGRIINISSIVGSMGNVGQSNYAATKAGIEGFSRALARELASRGVTVNAVAPGFIDTDMTRKIPEEQRDILLAQIPLARLGEVEEVAAMVGFLASDKAAYITGETIHINGGMYMA